MKRQIPDSNGAGAKAETGNKAAKVTYDPAYDEPLSSWNFGKNHGISLEGLRYLAATSGKRSCREQWREVWAHDTAAPGWTLELFFDDGIWVKQTYSNKVTGETVTRTPTNLVCPEGCRTVISARPDLEQYLGSPTHALSHPWSMTWADIAEAVESMSGVSAATYFWVDILASNYHSMPSITLALVREFTRGLRSLPTVQVCAAWDDPERFQRVFLMIESCTAVASGQSLYLCMPLREQARMADALRTHGPAAILDVVYGMDLEPSRLHGSVGSEDMRAHVMHLRVHL